MRLFRALLGGVLITTAALGCSSCGTNSGVWGGNSTLPAGKATLVFAATSASGVAVPISAVDVTVTLPQGITLATSGSGSEQIATDAVSLSTGLSGTSHAVGSYTTSTGKTRLSMITSSNSYRNGEYLRLSCNVAANTGITSASLAALPVTVEKAVGYDPATKTSVTLTDKVNVTLALK